MKNQKVIIIFIALVLSCKLKVNAQDALFTNYLNTPLQTNPSLVAFDNNMKISVNYRGRFTSFGQDYNMPLLTFVHPLMNQDRSERWGGIGFSVISDMSANSQVIKTTGANFAFAYNLKLKQSQFISASLGAGYFRRNANLYGMSTGSQYVPNQGYDPNLPLNETFSGESTGYLDLSAGIIWYMDDKLGENKAFAGISAFHLNKPDISLNSEADYLPFRYAFQAGYSVFSNDKVILFPDFNLDYQAKLLRYNVGLEIKIPLTGKEQDYINNASVCFKPRYMSDNLASMGIEFQKPNYSVSFIYDFSVANSTVNSNVVNAYEVQILYKKNRFKPKQIKEKVIGDDQYIVGQERVLNKNNEIIVVHDTVYMKDTSRIKEKLWSEKLSDPERKITFNYKSDKIVEEAKKDLDEIIEILKQNMDYVIEIEGHTDNIGDAESNKRQSLRRALTISDYFEKQGIARSRIRVSGRGASKPISTNATEEGRAKNRRVEFRLYRMVK